MIKLSPTEAMERLDGVKACAGCTDIDGSSLVRAALGCPDCALLLVQAIAGPLQTELGRTRATLLLVEGDRNKESARLDYLNRENLSRDTIDFRMTREAHDDRP